MANDWSSKDPISSNIHMTTNIATIDNRRNCHLFDPIFFCQQIVMFLMAIASWRLPALSYIWLDIDSNSSHIGVSIVMGVPQNRWCLLMENPRTMDDFGVPPFQETSIFQYISGLCC